MKDVILSKSAWHVKFFTWATGSAPKWNNLCPYFWSLVSLLLFSPLILAWKIVKEYVYKEPTPKSIRRSEIILNSLKWIGRIISGAYILSVVALILRVFYQLFMAKGALFSFTYILSGIGAITVLFAIVWGVMSYFKSDTHIMIVSMIKAKKNKYCPHVTWKE